jgi:hypothetical protein
MFDVLDLVWDLLKTKNVYRTGTIRYSCFLPLSFPLSKLNLMHNMFPGCPRKHLPISCLHRILIRLAATIGVEGVLWREERQTGEEEGTFLHSRLMLMLVPMGAGAGAGVIFPRP